MDLKKTAFYNLHIKHHAKMTDFGGWDMPLHYGSQIAEHQLVRSDAGMFDVSHMVIGEISGADATAALMKILAADVRKLLPFQALYSAMLNEKGGIIDDLIVYRLYTDNPNENKAKYWIIHNASRAQIDGNWITKQICENGWNVEYQQKEDYAMLAIQGANARLLSTQVNYVADFKNQLLEINKFYAVEIPQINAVFARTGYTGEDGFEWMFPAKYADKVWQELITVGINPCGLASRDSLRLEAGMALYGNDLDENNTPDSSNIGWSVAISEDRDFIGKAAIIANRENNKNINKIYGLILSDGGVMRSHQKVRGGQDNLLVGEITSGGYSPVLKKSIALARLPAMINLGDEVEVNIREKWYKAKVVKPTFVRNGKVLR